MARIFPPKFSRIDVDAELKKPRLIAVLFADWSQEGADRKVALGGIFDRIRVVKGKPARFSLFIRLLFTAPVVLDVLVYRPDGTPHASMRGNPPDVGSKPLSADEPNYLQLLTATSMDFPEPGNYWFEVRLDNEVLGFVPLIVEEVPDGDPDTLAD